MKQIDEIMMSLSPMKDTKNFPRFSSGDTISVFLKVKEGEKERIQVFKGTVIKVQGSGVGRAFTVRKISGGVGVEKTFPFVSPAIDKIEVNLKGKVRRARIFYLRGLKGRAARLQTEMVHQGSKQRSSSRKSKETGSSPVPETQSSSPIPETQSSSKPAYS